MVQFSIRSVFFVSKANLFHVYLNIFIKQWRSGSALSANIPALSPVQVLKILYTSSWCQIEKNSAALNNRYLDTLVNDNHVDNNLTKTLVYVNFKSTVNKTVQNMYTLCVGTIYLFYVL